MLIPLPPDEYSVIWVRFLNCFVVTDGIFTGAMIRLADTDGVDVLSVRKVVLHESLD